MSDSNQINDVTFKCYECKSTFDAEPSRVEDCERAHPWAYFATCPKCSEESGQAPWQIANFCSLSQSTGPRTRQGKAKSSQNLALRSPDTIERSKFNALKHGAYAQAALTFPARPGKYPQCANCDIDHDYCAQQPACIKKTELLIPHLAAFESGDPSHLKQISAIRQGQVAAIFSDMVAILANDGVVLRSPKHFFSQDGKLHLAQYDDPDTGEKTLIQDVKAHPVLKPLAEFLSRNNYGLAEQNMTPKVVDEQNIQMGNLNVKESEKLSTEQYARQNADKLKLLQEQIESSKERTKNDPILIEHNTDD